MNNLKATRPQFDVACKTSNSIEYNLRAKHQCTHANNKYLATDIDKLTVPDCGKAYAVQTGRSFTKRFKENFPVFRSNSTSDSRNTLWNIVILSIR
jgi:hypothetical protein